MFARALAALLLLAALANAQEQPRRFELSAEDLPEARHDWYGLYVEGAKVGWVHFELGLRADGTLVEAVRSHVKLVAFGESVEMSQSEELRFDGTAPFALRSGESVSIEGDNEIRIRLERSEAGFVATVTNSGRTRRQELGEVDYTFADSVAHERWVRSGPAVGDALVVRAVLLDELRVSTERFEVTRITEALVQGVETRIYEGPLSTPEDGDLGIYRADASGLLLSATMPAGFELRLEPEETAKQLEKGGDLFVAGMVRIATSLGPFARVTELELEVSGEGAARLVEGPLQSFEEGPAEGTRILRLGRRFGRPAAATEEEIREALEETVALPISDETVVALARRAIGDAEDDERRVRRLLQFVSDYVADELAPEAATVLDVIRKKKGDCTEHAMLFNALARAAGIPSRSVSGFLYMGDKFRAFGGHEWNEVAIDGKWVPVDATWNQMPVDATHVSFGSGKKGETNFGWATGRLAFKVLRFEREPDPNAD